MEIPIMFTASYIFNMTPVLEFVALNIFYLSMYYWLNREPYESLKMKKCMDANITNVNKPSVNPQKR
jgi:hypothetical protein